MLTARATTRATVMTEMPACTAIAALAHRDNGITSMALNASRDGRPLYEAMGYAVSPSPMMFLSLD